MLFSHKSGKSYERLTWCLSYTGFVMVWKSLEKSLVSRKVWKSLEKSGKVWNFHHFSVLSLEKSGKMIYLGQANFLYLYVWHWTLQASGDILELIFNFSLALVLTLLERIHVALTGWPLRGKPWKPWKWVSPPGKSWNFARMPYNPWK